MYEISHKKSGEMCPMNKNYCFSIKFSRFYLEAIRSCFIFAPKIIIERQ